MSSIELPEAPAPSGESVERVQVEAGAVDGTLEAPGRGHPPAALRILTRDRHAEPNVDRFVRESHIRSGDGLTARFGAGEPMLVVSSVAGD